MGTTIETFRAENAPRDPAQLLALRGPQRYYLALSVCGKIGVGLTNTDESLAFRALPAEQQVSMIMGWLAQYDAANGAPPGAVTAPTPPPARRPEPEQPPRQMDLPTTKQAPVPRTPVEDPNASYIKAQDLGVGRVEKVEGPAGQLVEAMGAIKYGVESMNTVVGYLTKAQEQTNSEMSEMRAQLNALTSAVVGNMQLLQVISGYMFLVGEGVLNQQGLPPDAVAAELKTRELETKPLSDLLAALGEKQGQST
jgi:hypothetical protein